MIGNLHIRLDAVCRAHGERLTRHSNGPLSEMCNGALLLFIAAGTWAMPFFASYIDKFGPRYFMVISGVLCAVGWGALGHVPEF